MRRLSFLGLIACLTLAACSNPDEERTAHQPSAESVAPLSGERQPDIVIILADDLGFSDLSSYGGEVPTPNIDRLADEGLKVVGFRSTAKCFPSRAALLTGSYPQEVNRHRSARTPMIGGKTIAESLREVGYQTFMVGKHHGVTNPVERGFDRYWGLRDGASNHFNPGTEARPGEPEPGRKKQDGRFWCDDLDCGKGLKTEEGFYSTRAFTDKAVALIDDALSRDDPYLLYIAYTAPHDPLHAPAETVARFRGAYDDGWSPVAEARYQRQVAMGLVDGEAPRRPHLWRDWQELTPEERADQTARMEIYAAMIAELDAGVGRVIEALEERGTLENTLIIFASDNGASAELVLPDGEEIGADHPVGSVGRWASLGPDWAEVGNTPFRFYKNDSYEGGTSGPLLIRWPNGVARAGRTEFALSHLLDIHPTLIDVASAAEARDLRGISLHPLLNGEPLPRRPQPLFNQWQDNQAVWEGDWKLVARDGGNWALYDLSVDPHETRDLAAERPFVKTRLASAYDQWLGEVLPEEE